MLAAANVMSNAVVPEALYVAWNLCVAAAVAWIGWRAVGPDACGFGSWRRGLRWGGALFAVTAAGLVIGSVLPGLASLYRDSRVEPGAGTMLYHALVRIPLGTVVLEEVAFRGVLPALLALSRPARARTAHPAPPRGWAQGVVGASVLFGLWHVLPALGLTSRNRAAADAFGTGDRGTVLGVVFAVVATAAAGLWLCWLRLRSRSVLTTVLAHIATNSVAYVVAWVTLYR